MSSETIGRSTIRDISEAAMAAGLKCPVLITQSAWDVAIEPDTTGKAQRDERVHFLTSALFLEVCRTFIETEKENPDEEAALPSRFGFQFRGIDLAVVVGVTPQNDGLRMLVGNPETDDD